MNLRKLIPMTDYVNQVLAYVEESHNYQRGIELIKWYSEFIQQPIQVEMFKSEEPLFPALTYIDSREHLMPNTITRYDVDFAVKLYRKSPHLKRMSEITSFHLAKIEDLCDKELDFNIDSDFVDTNLFD